MDSPVSPKDEIWFLRVCHHISNAVYFLSSVENVWMATLKLKFLISLAMATNIRSSAGNIIWPFTGTDNVVSTDTEHEDQHL